MSTRPLDIAQLEALRAELLAIATPPSPGIEKTPQDDLEREFWGYWGDLIDP